jgi:hypothetical protein
MVKIPITGVGKESIMNSDNGFSGADEVSLPGTWAIPGRDWDLQSKTDWIRDFRIVHNTTTIFEPCCRCGAAYYRGPYQIVKHGSGILCIECASKSPIPVVDFFRRYMEAVKQWFCEVPCDTGNGTVRIIAGITPHRSRELDATDALPDHLNTLLDQLRQHAEENRALTVYFIKSLPDQFHMYSHFEHNTLQEVLFQKDERSVINGFIRQNRKAFAEFEYLLLQRIDPQSPTRPQLIRTHEEWKRL